MEIRIKDGNENRNYSLESFGKDKVYFGREGKDIIIIGNGISRAHGYFEWKNGVWYICDNNSSNGTAVNGKEIKQAELHKGDFVELASRLPAYKIIIEVLSDAQIVPGGDLYKESQGDLNNTIGFVSSNNDLRSEIGNSEALDKNKIPGRENTSGSSHIERNDTSSKNALILIGVLIAAILVVVSTILILKLVGSDSGQNKGERKQTEAATEAKGNESLEQDKTEGSSEAAETAKPTEEEQIEEEQTEEASEEPSWSEVEAREPVKIKTASNNWKEAYNEIIDTYYGEFGENGRYESTEGYLYDFDHDGIPEIILCRDSDEINYIETCYGYVDGDLYRFSASPVPYVENEFYGENSHGADVLITTSRVGSGIEADIRLDFFRMENGDLRNIKGYAITGIYSTAGQETNPIFCIITDGNSSISSLHAMQSELLGWGIELQEEYVENPYERMYIYSFDFSRCGLTRAQFLSEQELKKEIEIYAVTQADEAENNQAPSESSTKGQDYNTVVTEALIRARLGIPKDATIRIDYSSQLHTREAMEGMEFVTVQVTGTGAYAGYVAFGEFDITSGGSVGMFGWTFQN